MENGFPTNKIVPGSLVRKTATEMTGQASDDATVATNFRFDTPILLPAKAEFAIVVTTNSFNYKLWHATVGENDITGSRLTATNNQFKITKNPYAGVSFKSANQSTWEPDSNTDFKFKINFVKFGTNSTVTRDFTTVLPQNSAGASINTTKATAVCLLSNQMVPTGTRVDYVLVQKVGGVETRYNLIPNDHVELNSQMSAITSSTDLRLVATLTSQNEFLTPVIDLERMSFLVFNNVINNDSTNETRKEHGNALSRYITRRVALDNSATKLDVFLDLAKPSGTDIKVYVRANQLTAGDNTTDELFEEMTGDNIPINSGLDTNRANFTEAHFVFDLQKLGLLTSAASSNPGGFTTPVSEFNQFEVKIVLLSSDPANIPQIKNLRCIATS